MPHLDLGSWMTRLRTVLLKSGSFAAWRAAHAGVGAVGELPYAVDRLADFGIELLYSDLVEHPRARIPLWARPSLQSVAATRTLARADVVLALFESQGHSVAALRRAGVWPYSGPALVIVACWLAHVMEHEAGPIKRAAFRQLYRSVDRIICFSSNQIPLLQRHLELGESRIVSVPFGIDQEYFRHSGRPAEDYAVAVGRDRGRDWETLFSAVSGTGIRLRVACRPNDVRGMRLPEEVELLGYLDRRSYRDLLDRARFAVICTENRVYPTGQSVLLEAMAMRRACLVSNTTALSEYVEPGVTAISTPVRDVRSLREGLLRLWKDRELCGELGQTARSAVEQRFNAPLMWSSISRVLHEAAGRSEARVTSVQARSSPDQGVKVLFVCHEGSRTGAPRAAVQILRILKDRGLSATAVLRWNGDISSELAANAEQLFLEPWRHLRVALRRFKSGRRLAVQLEELMATRLIRELRPDLLYLNTSISACYARPALEHGIPVILHVHEHEPLCSKLLGRYDFDRRHPLLRWAACSQAVRDSLVGTVGADASAVRVIPSLVDLDRVKRLAEAPSVSHERDGFIRVVACGTADLRKGVDLWLRMARLVVDRAPEAPWQFIWIGRLMWPSVESEVRRLDLESKVKFVGELSNPYPLMAQADIFTLTSRAETFAMVVVEAMSLEVPVVAFRVGGVGEPMGDTGRLVPAEDVEAMVEEVIRLGRDPAERRRLGERGRARALECLGLEQLRGPVEATIRDALETRPGP